MMSVWKNPEFVRHFRGELRTTRALSVAAVVAVIAVLIWLGCWGSRASEMAAIRQYARNPGFNPQRLAEMDRESPTIVWFGFYRLLMYTQLVVLTFWSLFSCAQSISTERERKTWDFQRATRLSPGELLTGKLLGEPVLGYFIVACCLPIALLSALMGQAGLENFAEAYLVIISSAIFVGIVGLWLSSLFESRSRGVGLIGTFGLYLIFALIVQARDSDFPGLAGLSPLATFIPLFDKDVPSFTLPAIFGKLVPWVIVGLALYLALGGWLVLTLLRTLTRDYDQMRTLSRWQAIGCGAFLNFVAYALYVPRFITTLDLIAKFMAALNGVILFAIGLAMLTSSERLRVWWRTRGATHWALLAADGPQWPWLVLSAAIGYVLLSAGLFVWQRELRLAPAGLGSGLVEFAVVLMFVTRDITFIQWCRLTRMRAPVLKGVLFVGLYYVAAVVLSAVTGVYAEKQGQHLYALLTPVGVFLASPFRSNFSFEVFVGIGIQVTAIVVLEMVIMARLQHPLPRTAHQ